MVFVTDVFAVPSCSSDHFYLGDYSIPISLPSDAAVFILVLLSALPGGWHFVIGYIQSLITENFKDVEVN